MRDTLRRLLGRADTLFMEWWLGINTRGVRPASVPGGTDYVALSYGTIRKVLDRLELQPDDVLVDLGCGLGRVVCMAARYELADNVGVEADERLADVARDNRDRQRGRTPTSPIIHNMKAQDYHFGSSLLPTSVVVMYNPFDASVMRATLERMKATRTRPIRIAYVNPRCRDVLTEYCGNPYESWPQSTDHAVMFWRLG